MKRGGFFFELRRRRVWRVAGAYVVIGWMIVEIVLGTFPLLGAPGWVDRAVVVAAFLGFPVAVLLAWAFDITAHGVVRTPALESDGAEPAPAPVVLHAGPGRLAGVFGAGILVALVGFGAYSVSVADSDRVGPESIHSIAVLPFADLSAEQNQGYFADGVTEELINRLARLGELRVAARTSSFAFKGSTTTLTEVARLLNVDAVVDGSVRRDGDQLRITVELVDARTGFPLWSERYDRTADDIFAIQDDISASIVDALRLHLVPGAARLMSGTASVRAHDTYLLGLARWHSRTEEDLLRALRYFEEAVAEDPSFAHAHAGIALTYAVLPVYSDIASDTAAERGAAAAARALALNAQIAEAHAAIGQIAQVLEWNLEAAETAYRRALEFQPSYATGHQWYAETLMLLGRLEASRREIDAALAIDPLSVAARHTLGYLQMVQREYAAARSTYRALVREHPGYRPGHLGLAFLCLVAECPDDARAAIREAFPDDVAAALVLAARAGDDPALRAAAAAALASVADRVDPAQLALFHAAIGDTERAMSLIEQSFRSGDDPNLPFVMVHPVLDPLRPDPRFRHIATTMGVEAPTARVPTVRAAGGGPVPAAAGR